LLRNKANARLYLSSKKERPGEILGSNLVSFEVACNTTCIYVSLITICDCFGVAGTIAVAVRIGVLEYPITSHDDLRVQYFRARSSGLKLHVIFINSEVTTRPFDANADKDWSENGRWNNRIERGWAGGAKTKKGIAAQQKSVQANRNAAHLSNDVPTVEFNNGETSSSVDTAGAQTIDDTSEVTWVSTTTKISPQHRTLARSLEGIRKEASGPRGNPRSVKFTTSETTKHFVFGTPAAEWVVPSHTIPRITPAHKHRERELSPEDAVKDAVQKHQYQKLIQVLEDGASTNYDVLKNIKEQHDFVKVSIIKTFNFLTLRCSLLIQIALSQTPAEYPEKC
jgi:hypothetical protein